MRIVGEIGGRDLRLYHPDFGEVAAGTACVLDFSTTSADLAGRCRFRWAWRPRNPLACANRLKPYRIAETTDQEYRQAKENRDGKGFPV